MGRTLGDAGQAMVEFAFIAPVLLGLLCGIFEFSGILFAQTLLEGGARQASRFGITGSEGNGLSRQERILNIVDDNAYGIIETDNINMETLVYESFADVGQAEPFTDANGNGEFDDGEAFDDINGNGAWDEDMGTPGLGGAGDIVVYRLQYDWEIMIPLFRPIFGDTVPLDANIAVRNEPFGS
ncbi:MAG: TadE family protein [Pseudomonadota bacterium]